MKKQLLTLAAIFTLAASAAFGQCVTEDKKDDNKFFVAGNCGMCETRIEDAAKKVEGVTGADWDKETKMLTVNFDCANPDVKTVHKAVAAVGHDTKLFRAEDAVYEKLPACCKFERIAQPDIKGKKE
ncbi:MAG TPA: ATPase [Bacteroidetes bacterium]|nr:ATPase [Bacteroidota bacterium]